MTSRNPSRLLPASPAQLIGVGMLLLCSAAAVFAQNSPPPTPLTALYESEADAIRKARAFPKYGEALFAEIRKDVQSEQFPAALAKLADYIDRLKAMRQELRSAVPNPEKKSNGFKQLQIHVRKVLRSLEHTIVSVPVAERAPFVAGRRDIELIDRELITDLFPRQPGRKEPDPDKDKP